MLKKIANTVRVLTADAIEDAQSGHPGLPIGCAEIGSLLYGEILKHDPKDPSWPGRDRFVLSAGHGSMLLYSLLHLSGYDISLSDLKNFRQLGSKTPGHPEYGLTEGIETTTGPLGQGFANAVGMALAERIKVKRFNTKNHKIVDNYTFCLIGDGGMMEGVTSESASLAGHLALGKLIAIYDDNEISIAGNTELTFTENVADRFKAYNWQVIENVDGHDVDELRKAINDAKSQTQKPTLIMAKTKIAFGAPSKEGTAEAHGAPLGEEEIRGLKKNIDFPVDKKYYIPDEVIEYFNSYEKELSKDRLEWMEEFNSWSEENPKLKVEWDEAENLFYPSNLRKELASLKIETPIATRSASGITLRKIADQIPNLIGGAADLSPSTKTYLDKYNEIQADSYNGRNIRFGVREHGMGAIINGISLYGGFRPFCATFLSFADYMRPSIRMAALMKLPVIYVFTHDSVYIGEDGPTHQPIEQIESLRIIPGLKVFRPADEEETKAAWYKAIKNTNSPTALILTRQNLPHLEKEQDFWYGLKNGAYTILSTYSEEYEYTFLATGSEVSLAVDIAHKLINLGKKVKVISVPNRGEFKNEKNSYLKNLINGTKKIIVMEAGIGSGWYKLIDRDYELISIEDYGGSAPGEKIAKEKGFSVDEIIDKIIN
jgi:transketolase